MLSTNCKCETIPPLLSISTPEKISFFLAYSNMQFRISPTIKTNNDERETPWHNPLFGENSLVREPLTKKEILIDLKIDSNHETHIIPKFIFRRYSKRKGQLIESKALAKSNFRIWPSILPTLRPCTIALAIRALSEICRPLINAVWGSTRLESMTSFNLFTKYFSKELYQTINQTNWTIIPTVNRVMGFRN